MNRDLAGLADLKEKARLLRAKVRKLEKEIALQEAVHLACNQSGINPLEVTPKDIPVLVTSLVLKSYRSYYPASDKVSSDLCKVVTESYKGVKEWPTLRDVCDKIRRAQVVGYVCATTRGSVLFDGTAMRWSM